MELDFSCRGSEPRIAALKSAPRWWKGTTRNPQTCPISAWFLEVQAQTSCWDTFRLGMVDAALSKAASCTKSELEPQLRIMRGGLTSSLLPSLRLGPILQAAKHPLLPRALYFADRAL